MFTTIIIPDLHGDFDEFINILKTYDILKDTSPSNISSIIHGNMYKTSLNMENKRLIQLGDLLDSRDRCDNNKYALRYTDMKVFNFICNMKRAFPRQIVLIMGNHELLNCRKRYDYVSPLTPRTDSDYSIIVDNVRELFDYYYVDENANLYIHACIPNDVTSIEDLSIISKFLTLNLVSDTEEIKFENLYSYIFSRDYATTSTLDMLGIKNAFFGHTPHENVYNIDNRIFYVDTMISRSFCSRINSYDCMHITMDNNVIYIDKIQRSIKYH